MFEPHEFSLVTFSDYGWSFSNLFFPTLICTEYWYCHGTFPVSIFGYVEKKGN